MLIQRMVEPAKSSRTRMWTSGVWTCVLLITPGRDPSLARALSPVGMDVTAAEAGRIAE